MRSVVVFVLLGIAQSVAAADPAPAANPAGVPVDAATLARMTPAELEALRSELDAQTAKLREESAALAARVEALERLNAETAAKQAALDSEYQAALERLSKLEAGPAQ
jgi:Skp family chaperone for outer membrane proteins